MPRILRPLLLLALLSLALVATACGGGEEAASSSDDPKALLKETFSGDKNIDSGKVDLKISLDVKGGKSQLQGPVNLTVNGPFQSQGDKKLPKFDLDAAFSGAGIDIKAGATSTGEKGFLALDGKDYAISDQVFQQFKTGFEQAQKDNKDSEDKASLQTLGINPQNWLSNPKNEGEADVNGDEAIKITGDVDVPKLLDDVNKALEKAAALGLNQTGRVPGQLTDEQKKQVADAVKDLSVEIYTGKEDKILRRIVVDLDIAAPESEGGGSGAFKLDLAMSGINEDQEISEPKDARPFEELGPALQNLLGGLGLGGAGGGSGGSGGGSGSGSGSGGSAELDKYSDCVEKAGNDLEKVQECSSVLGP